MLNDLSLNDIASDTERCIRVQLCTLYTHNCFTPFTIEPLRYVSCLLLSVGSSLQMELTQKFKDVASGIAVRIEFLDVDKRYPVLRAEWLKTKYGKTMLLAVREDDRTVVKMLLTKWYGVLGHRYSSGK